MSATSNEQTVRVGGMQVTVRVRVRVRVRVSLASAASALPAASGVMENVVGYEVAKAFLEKFGGDTMDEVEGAGALWGSRSEVPRP